MMSNELSSQVFLKAVCLIALLIAIIGAIIVMSAIS